MSKGRRAELERAAGCHRRRPPPDLSWLFSQVSKAAVDTLEDKQNGSSVFRVMPGGTDGISLLEQQTYRQWKSFMGLQKLSHPRRLRRHTIILQPFSSPSLPGYPLSEVAPVVLQHLQRFCTAFFTGMTVELSPPLNLTSVASLTSRIHPSTNRRQYLVADILSYLQRRRPSHAQCVIGVATVDLYPSPEWNFVLGHASLTSGCGIFGFGRYFSSQFSNCSPTIHQQLGQLWVLARVVTHELCHTLGMKHCYYFHCAMNESTSIEEAATQPLFLCPVCLRKLKKWLKFDIFERYSQMKAVIEEMVEVAREVNPEMSDYMPTDQNFPENHVSGDGGVHPTSGAESVGKLEPTKSSLSSRFQLLRLQEASQWLHTARGSTHSYCQS